MRLITHNGTFHADEVTASAILTTLFPRAEIVRTRDAETIRSAQGKDIVFDVGSVYSHEDRRYDHHMVDGPKRQRDGSPYSSVGLVWRHYGLAYVSLTLETDDVDLMAKVWKSVDEGLVKEIDLLDNGVGTMSSSSLPALVDDLNPAWDSGQDSDEAFRHAVAMVRPFVANRVAAAAARCRAEAVVFEAASSAEDPRIVVLPASMPWEGALFDGGFEDALYVVYPKTQDAWYCSAVPPEPGSFAQRKPLPAEWAGLRDEGLAEVCGAPDATFCHPARFVCGARSREGVVAMAKAACEAKPEAGPAP